ncbi:FAD-dependent thymidylate synthase [Candidatus Woesearchaeota archaeon]|jgi:thymidylate synthase (FAD)|nr:FAD-dependent thymidylate synthase [Candidatus Woesearchaeota archaeon]MBT4321652.1 FAD-dependent thymidylate synthase [Candidatus Woesearchaeota archaeon]MBT4631037.1 FAD-dependent thymidylate synthase [Candidatus Woesearchaeota archaeon]
MPRAISNGLDSILDEKFPVLDHGFIIPVDYMGNDSAIVQAARTSYGKGTKKISEDRDLIRYLMRHRHTTPLEMCELKLHVMVPMDIWRQWIRHRTASVNEYSTRYSEAIDEKKTTSSEKWRLQGHHNRQGSEGFLDQETGKTLTSRETEFHREAERLYHERLDAGVAREQARKDLPLSTYTRAYWKMDLHNLLHFSALRLDEKAQLEIREYAQTIGKIIKAWVPLTWEAFEDYRLNALTLSQPELQVNMLVMKGMTLDKALTEVGITNKTESREIREKFRLMYPND